MAKGKMPPPSVRPWTWYKTFTRLIDDPRFLLLNEIEQRHYMLIYCCKAQGIIDRFEDDQQQLLQMVATKLRVQKNVLELAVMHMWEVKLLIQNTLQPVDWDAEQAEPPTSGAARVAKHRAKAKPTGALPPSASDQLQWPNCIPAGDLPPIQRMLHQLQHLERDGEPVAQLLLDEIAGIVGAGQVVKSFPKLAAVLVNKALVGEFHPEYGKSISAARRRRGEPLQIPSR